MYSKQYANLNSTITYKVVIKVTYSASNYLVVTLSSEYYTIIYPRKPIFSLLKMGFLTEKNTVPAKMPERLALL